MPGAQRTEASRCPGWRGGGTRGRGGLRLAAIIAASLLVLVGILIAADFLAFRGQIHQGVRVWGQDLSGLPAAEAAQKLSAQAVSRLQVARTVVAEAGSGAESSLPLVPAEAGVELDVEACVQAALSRGREGGPLGTVLGRLSLWLSPQNLEPVFRVNTPAWASACDGVALQFEKLPEDAELILENGEPQVLEAESGLALERSQLQQRLLEAISTGAPRIACPLEEVSPEVTTDQAAAALDAARGFFSGPIEIRYQETSVSISREELLQIADFAPAGIASGRPVTVDTERGRALLEQKLAFLEKPALDAQVLPSEDGSSYSVIPSQDGVSVEWERLLAAVDSLALRRDQQYVPLPVTVSHPRLTTLDAELLRERSPVASFTTYFSPDNPARVNNIKQVAQLLDGRVVRAGETFSFNQAVGPRTKAAGFDEAPVISNGVLTQGVGGGICQVSTTLFNTVLLAGLPIVQRAPHSFYIERYPVGRDATVSYGEQDFQFRNDTDNLLIMNAEAGEGYVRITFSAAAWDRYGVCDETQVSGLTPPSSSPEQPRVYRDPALAAGETSAVEAGIDGRTAEFRRRVYSSDSRLLFEDTFRSQYAPKDWLLRVGA